MKESGDIEADNLPARIRRWLFGSLVAIGAILGVEGFGSFFAVIPAPETIYVAAIVGSGLSGGLGAGLFSAALIMSYLAVRFAIPGQPFTDTSDNLLRLLTLLATLPALALLIRQFKQRAARPQGAPPAETVMRQRYTQLLDQVHDAVVVTDLNGVVTDWNRGAERLFGYPAADALGRHVTFVYPEEAYRFLAEEVIARPKANETHEAEVRMRCKDGRDFYARLTLGLLRDARGQPSGMIGSAMDITDHREALAELARKNEQLQQLTATALIITANSSISSLLQTVTERAAALIDAQMATSRLTFEADWSQVATAVWLSDKYAAWRSFDERPDGSGLYRMVWQNNQPLRLTQADLEAHPAWRRFGRAAERHPPLRGLLAAPFIGRDGRNLGVIQLSDKVEGEFTANDEAVLLQLAHLAAVAFENAHLYQAACDAEARLAAVLEQMPDGVLIAEAPSGRMLLGNAQVEMIWRHPVIASASIAEYGAWRGFHRDMRPYTAEEWPLARAIRHGAVVTNEEIAILRGDRTCGVVSVSAAPIRDAGGAIVAGVATFSDITARNEAEVALRAAEQRLTLHVENSPLAVVEWDSAFRVRLWSGRAEQIFGWQADEVQGKHPSEWPFVHPDDWPAVTDVIRRLLDGADQRNVSVNRNLTSEGKVRHCEWYNSVLFDAAGGPISVLSLVLDTTDRQHLETQFLQAQKMETVGRLAGGIAHDFNNLLTVILGCVEFVQDAVAPDSRAANDLVEIQQAAERAAALTRQLLTFARKQVMQPRSLNLNDLILEMDKLLRRLIGEDIELITLPAASVYPVLADAGQIEQVLVNLVVNARDAMPNGGRLTIETGNVVLDATYAAQYLDVTPGPYVLLAVSDTGAGIAPEIRPHLFEPFFTTKPQGKGTGLGLATCYGIIKQHGGHIGVYSELGQGSSFKVYLPITAVEAADDPEAAPLVEMPRGNETILLVEDEPAVRTLAARALREQGYTVLEAGNGADALRLIRTYPLPIHLLFTDIVMPQMGGKELADRLKTRMESLRVLFTSGYAESAISHHGRLEPDVAYLPKPFTPAALARAVRGVLDDMPLPPDDHPLG